MNEAHCFLSTILNRSLHQVVTKVLFLDTSTIRVFPSHYAKSIITLQQTKTKAPPPPPKKKKKSANATLLKSKHNATVVCKYVNFHITIALFFSIFILFFIHPPHFLSSNTFPLLILCSLITVSSLALVVVLVEVIMARWIIDVGRAGPSPR